MKDGECMADVIQSLFERKKVNFEKASCYGFVKTDDLYTYKRTLDNGFLMTVRLSEAGKVTAEIIDTESNEPYTLHLSDDASGSFVGNVRMQYEALLIDIADKCFERDVFKSDIAARLIDFVRSEYGGELEFLWKNFPDYAVWRRSDSGKWYGALMKVPLNKLGIDSREKAEILDLRISGEELNKIVDNQRYFPGYHMNKKSWVSVVLDGSVSFEEICEGIRKSYLLAK